jgi:hypothetical protein
MQFAANDQATAALPRRVHGALKRFFSLVTLAACVCLMTPSVSYAEFYGKKGYTVVFAFSESTARYGWGYNRDPDAAAATALENCGVGAKVACYRTDGYLCLVWDGSKYAFGHDDDSAQSALGHAMESFENLHGGRPTNFKVRSSDGEFIQVN